jgi:acetoin utilization deacetylase AcuC-like enzyme
VTFPAVWSELHRLHDSEGEIWVGVRIPGDELPVRADVIRSAVEDYGCAVVEAVAHPDDLLRRVHDPAMLDYMASAHERWVAAGYPVEPGQDRVVPYVFPLPQVTAGLPRRVPASAAAMAGVYGMDTMTSIGPGTYRAARAAVDVAMTAAEVVAAGAPMAYAICRPPGHHAGRDYFGGSCYLNNAAVAVETLLAAGMDRVAVVDLDAHHGNGTQHLFYERPDVFYGSVHVDPGAGWFPHFAGFADERGAGAGLGSNVNRPLAPGSGDGDWLAAVDELAEAAGRHGAGGLVVSLGVDAAADDPESPLLVTGAGFRSAGQRLAELGMPTVFVQEGGYHLATLGELVVAAVGGFHQAVASGQPA